MPDLFTHFHRIPLSVVGPTPRLAALFSLALNGCAQPCKCANPPIFGGQPEREKGAESSTESASDLPCSAPSPPETRALVDDFEDGDHAVAGAFEREGWLYIATDDTGGTSTPPRGDLSGTRLPEAERQPTQQFALFGAAQGFTDWGAGFGMTLRNQHNGNKCPVNASNFAGLRFRVRGKGRVHFTVQTPDTVPSEQEGRCTSRCWDTHEKVLLLTEGWQTYSLSWDQFQQKGWGTPARFTPERILGIHLALKKEDMPTEFWLDDLEFIPAQAIGGTQ